MWNIKKKNVFIIFAVIFISIVTIFYTTYLSRFCGYEGDDFAFGTYWDAEGIFTSLNLFLDRGHDGGYIASFLTKFFDSGLPLLLGIHPEDFMCSYHGILKGVILAVTLYSISKFSTIFIKSNIFQTSIYFLVSALFFLLLNPYYDPSNFYYANLIVDNNNFYRYPFCILVYSLFSFHLYKMICSQTKQIKPVKIVIYSLLAVILATNFEIFTLSYIAIIFFVYLYNIILFFRCNSCNISKYNINKSFTIYTLAFFIFFLVYWTKSSLQYILLERGLGNISIDINSIAEFTSIFLKIYIVNNSLYWIIFIIVSILAIKFIQKEHDKKKVFFPLFMLFSILISIYSLIFCGKTMYDTGNFWLEHGNIILAYKVVILIPLLILCSYVLSKIKDYKRLQKTLLALSIIIFIISSIISLFIKENEHYVQVYYDHKKNSYINEKILRFYYLKNQKPILAKENETEETRISNGETCTNTNLYTTIYYPMIYKDYKSLETGYCLQDNAMELFLNNGGNFSDEELGSLKFTKLFDDNFVLNKH